MLYVRPMLDELAQARAALPGPTVRYEEFTAEPEKVARGLCEFLGVNWEPEMLEYGRFKHSNGKVFLGDNSAKIVSGRIQPGRPLPLPDDIPPALVEPCQILGYLPVAG